MLSYIQTLQWLSLNYFGTGGIFFASASAIIVLVNISVRVRNQRHRPPRAYYHFTSTARLKSIYEHACIKGGHQGRVFTTANKKFHNRGTGRESSRLRGHRSESRACVIFRGKSLNLFREQSGGWFSFFAGTSLYAEMSDEFVSRSRGNIQLTRFRMWGDVLLVTDAVFERPTPAEVRYAAINGFLLSIPKSLFSIVHLFTVYFIIANFVSWPLLRNCWLSFAMVFCCIYILSVVLAQVVYFLFRKHLVFYRC